MLVDWWSYVFAVATDHSGLICCNIV